MHIPASVAMIIRQVHLEKTHTMKQIRRENELGAIEYRKWMIEQRQKSKNGNVLPVTRMIIIIMMMMRMMSILTSPSPLLPALSIHIFLTFHLPFPCLPYAHYTLIVTLDPLPQAKCEISRTWLNIHPTSSMGLAMPSSRAKMAPPRSKESYYSPVESPYVKGMLPR